MIRSAMRKAFPDHWSFLLGEINVYCFIILAATGTVLALFFDPGHPYGSATNISFDVPAGLFLRQLHHWTALLFVAGIVLHAGRVFFTGAFRRPRVLLWLAGVTMLCAVLFEGFAGYSLPGDLLSGLGLRIAEAVMLSIPLAGGWISSALFAGSVPSQGTIPRLFALHVYLLPATIALLMTAHLALVWRLKHTQFAGRGRTEGNVVGSPLAPNYALRSMALGFGVAAIACALAALVQINPIWAYGPYVPWQAISPAQPDWYLGWLEGALRLGPPLDLHLFGHDVPPPFWPGIVLPALFFGTLFCWPFIERAITGDDAEHNLLDRARDVPWRTGVGAAALCFCAVLTLAGSDDVQALYTYQSVLALTDLYRVLLVLLPLATGFAAYAAARALQGREAEPAERVRIARSASGGFDEERVP